MDCLLPFLIQNLALQTPLQLFISTHFGNESFAVISSNYLKLNPNLDNVLNLKNPKVLLNPRTKVVPPSINQNYILIEDDIDSLNASLFDMLYNVDTRGNFLVILQNNATEDDLVLTFKTFWRYYIYNVVILHNWTHFVTWYPYNSCGTTVTLVRNSTNFFANKIPKNFKKCPIKTIWSTEGYLCKTPFNKTDPGYGVRALDTIGEKLNTKIQYIENPVKYLPWPLKKGGVAKLGKLFIDEEIDLGLAVTLLQGKDLENSHVLYEYPKNFVFPPRQKLRNSKNLLEIFTPETWCIYVVTVLTVAVLWKFFMEQSWQNSFFGTIQMTIQNCTTRVPCGTLPRIFFFVFLYGVTNLNWFYTSQWSGVLTQPSYEPKIKTLAELVKSDKKLRFMPHFQQHLEPFGADIYEKMKKKRDPWFNNVSINTWAEEFVKYANHGILVHRIEVENKFKDYKELNIVSYDSIFTIKISWVARRGFPLIQEYNHWAARIVESGFIAKWIHESAINVKKYNFSHFDGGLIPLNFDHLDLVFEVWICGLVVASLWFVLEVIWAKMIQKKEKQNIKR